MKLGRAIAAGAVLWAVALPFTAGTALADDEPSAPVATTPAPPAPDQAAPPSAVPEAPREATPDDAPGDPQVTMRPEGAPETGGGPADSGADLLVAGGAASVAVVAAGGVVLALRRRRAGAN